MARKAAETKTKTPRKTTEKIQSAFELSRLNKETILRNLPAGKAGKKAVTLLGLGIILVVALLYFFKGLFIAAMVNGEPISRVSVIKELEKQSGKATLESLITKKLILQEAKNRNIEIGQKEIDAEIKKIETNLKGQGTTLDQALSLQGMTKDQLISEVRLQLAIQKLVSSDVKITDKEVADFLTTNKGQFPEGASEEEMKKEATEQIKSQKLQEKTQAFLADLQKKAKVLKFVGY